MIKLPGQKKKGRKSKLEISEAKQQIQQMVNILEQKTILKEYNFNMIISNIQTFQKLIQIFSHLSQDIYIRVKKSLKDQERKLCTMLLYQDEGLSLKIQLNEIFFESFYMKHNKDFVVQHDNISQFIKQKNSFQLLQLYNKITNNQLQQQYVNSSLDMKLIYHLEPTYAGSESTIDFQEGKKPIILPQEMELFDSNNIDQNGSTILQDYYKIDLLLNLITNLYQNSSNNDIFVFKIYRNHVTLPKQEINKLIQQRVEIYLQRHDMSQELEENDKQQKQNTYKFKSVQGDTLYQPGQIKGMEIMQYQYEINLCQSQIQKIQYIYNQYQYVSIFFEIQENNSNKDVPNVSNIINKQINEASSGSSDNELYNDGQQNTRKKKNNQQKDEQVQWIVQQSMPTSINQDKQQTIKQLLQNNNKYIEDSRIILTEEERKQQNFDAFQRTNNKQQPNQAQKITYIKLNNIMMCQQCVNPDLDQNDRIEYQIVTYLNNFESQQEENLSQNIEQDQDQDNSI